MLTPKQALLLKHPNVQLLITSLQCEPVLSAEFKYSKTVQDRVSELVQGYQKALSLPVAARSVSSVIEDTTHGAKIDSGPPIAFVSTYKAWTCLSGKSVSCIF